MDEQEKSSIPKFGEWEAENTAFTYYFEKTRKVREGKLNSLSNSRAESPVRIRAQDDIKREGENSPLSSHYHQSNTSPHVQNRRHKHGSPKIRLVGQNDEIEGKNLRFLYLENGKIVTLQQQMGLQRSSIE